MDAGALVQLAPFLFAAVTGTTGATTALKGGQVAVARTGAGVYTFTVQAAGATVGAAPFAVGSVKVDITMRTSGTYNYVVTSSTVITVNTFAVDGVTATDKNFDITISLLEPVV